MRKNGFMVALKMLLILTIITGGIYPLLVTFISGMIFPAKSEGSLITVNNKIMGSSLIGQKFDSIKYFQSRPSAIEYNPLPSGGSNLGPTSDSLKKLIKTRKENFINFNSLNRKENIPNDILCSSASGLDPHISPETALLQIDRICKARGFEQDKKQKIIDLINEITEPRQLGFLGKPVINVLILNLALDNLHQN